MSFIDDDITLTFSADAPDTTAATVTVSSVAGTVYGYYHRPGATLSLDGTQIVTTEPAFECAAAAVPSFNKESDTITISSVAYNVLRFVQSDDGRVVIYFLGRD